MELRQTAISGQETEKRLIDEETKALSTFYKAFNERNLELMAQSWLNTNEISMDNPIGGIRRGWKEITTGYERIFDGKAEVYVEFYDYSIHATDEMFFATGRERGFFKTDTEQIDLAIRTTRIFRKVAGKWRQIHHHGSIDRPELLHRYQTAVFGGVFAGSKFRFRECVRQAVEARDRRASHVDLGDQLLGDDGR
jgi:hypothetical protein